MAQVKSRGKFMQRAQYIITFPEEYASTAVLYASELKEILVDQGIKAQTLRISQKSQDTGTAVEVILNASAILAAIKAIQIWFKIRYSAKINIKTQNGILVAENITNKTAQKLIDHFSKINK